MRSLLALCLCFALTHASAQSITYEDFRGVIPFLQKEDFKGAFERTKTLLQTRDSDSSDLRGIVTYMNLFSAAGMVSKQEMTYDDFDKNASQYIGRYIVMSAHPCKDSAERSYNALQFVHNEGGLQGMTITANNSRTSILCFEYFSYAQAPDTAALIGKNVRCGGILRAVESNPNRSTIWISRLHIDKAFARVMEPR